MSDVSVEVIGQEALERARKILAGIPNGLNMALKDAMSRAASHLRANSAKAVRKRYAISASDIRANESVKVSYTYHSGAQAAVYFSGKKIPLYRYDGSSKSPSHGRHLSARAHQLKSTSPVLFQNAFVAQMKNGHIGIFERTGGKTSKNKDEIKELMGSSVPQMLGNEEVADKLLDDVKEKTEARLDHNIMAILSGYMG